MKKVKRLNLRKVHRNSKFQSISTAILKRSILTLIITVVIASAVSLIYFNDLIISISEDKASASIHILEKEIDSLKSSQEVYLNELSSNDNIISIAKSKKNINIKPIISNIGNSTDIFNITISDVNGVIITSTNSSYKTGEDISGDSWIKAAMGGKVFSETGRNSLGFYSINIASPIYSGNTLVGVLSADLNLEDVSFLDEMKTIANGEITIFENDVSVNTTIVQNGERLIGTNLDSKIANTVISNKQEYIGKEEILGVPFITIYKPLLASDGSVTGVLFTGSDYSEIQRNIITVTIINNIISLIAVIVCIYILKKYIQRSLKNPLNSVVNAAKAIETGEIDVDVINQLKSITANDEIGSLARSMEGAVNAVNLLAENIDGYKNTIIEHDLTYTSDSSKHSGIYLAIVKIVENLFAELRSILSEINQAADGIDSGAEHVSSASQMLSQGATEQASSTEELAATISDISEQIKSNTVSSIQTSKLSDETGKVILQGSEYMNELMNAMEEINQSSREIEKIIKTIDDIAFQTNILALNAAVEAARAGAAGKGFAVVADEVRNLASKSADAAKSTTVLIERSATVVNKGSRIAKETEAALNDVVEKTNKANSLIKEISEASQRQSDSIYQVNLGVDQISNVVQANSATAEQIAASSEELSGQAHVLKEMVGKYKISKTSEII